MRTDMKEEIVDNKVFKVLSEFSKDVMPPPSGLEIILPTKILCDQGLQIDFKSSINRYSPGSQHGQVVATSSIDYSFLPDDPKIPQPAIGTVNPEFSHKSMNRRLLMQQ